MTSADSSLPDTSQDLRKVYIAQVTHHQPGYPVTYDVGTYKTWGEAWKEAIRCACPDKGLGTPSVKEIEVPE